MSAPPLPLPPFRYHPPSPPRLEFLENLDIVAMFSSEGEKVQYSNSISTSAARGAVEKWLLEVQETMIVSMRDVTAKARDVSPCMSQSAPYMSMHVCASPSLHYSLSMHIFQASHACPCMS